VGEVHVHRDRVGLEAILGLFAVIAAAVARP
jgi:hypothetical protein